MIPAHPTLLASTSKSSSFQTGGPLKRSVIIVLSQRGQPVQEQPVALEEAQGAVENVEQGEGIVGVLRLVCQPLDQALLLVDVLFRSANALLADGSRSTVRPPRLLQWRRPCAAPCRPLSALSADHGVYGEWPSRDRPALEEQVGLLFGWKPKDFLAWLVSNPNGPDPEEQEENLRRALVWAQNPRQAAALVLNKVYNRMRNQLAAL
jgi:hypothetical protein